MSPLPPTPTVYFYDGGRHGIQFAGSANTLTLGAGYVIDGIVDPSGENTLQLGGIGSGTFDLTSIGSAAQYRGFTTFMWSVALETVSGVGSGWNVNGGTLALPSGGLLLSTTVQSGQCGRWHLDGQWRGQRLERQWRYACAPQWRPPSQHHGAKRRHARSIERRSRQRTTVSNSGTFLVFSGGTGDPTRVLSGGTEIIASGGVDDGAQISGGVLVVQLGGSATNTNVRGGGREAVQSGAIVTGVISSGGAFELMGTKQGA